MFASLGAQIVKNLSSMREMRVRSLDQEDLVEKGISLPGESHEQRRLAGYSPQGLKQSDTTEQLTHPFSLFIHTLLKPFLTYS